MRVPPSRGQHVYGFPIGILKFGEGTALAVPGCVGNATSYDFPVLYKTVEGMSFDHLINKDRSVLPAVIEAAKWLEKEGARAIIANCGFFALFQSDLAEALDVPVYLSSLLQAPFLTLGLRKSEKLGIVTANASSLDIEFLRNAGIPDDAPIVIRGMEDQEHFTTTLTGKKELDTDIVCQEVVDVVLKMTKEDPSIKIILLECSELPPYAHKIQEVTGLPVFDYNTLIRFVFSGLVRKPFNGFM